jgi:hypothetical protein
MSRIKVDYEFTDRTSRMFAPFSPDVDLQQLRHGVMHGNGINGKAAAACFDESTAAKTSRGCNGGRVFECSRMHTEPR